MRVPYIFGNTDLQLSPPQIVYCFIYVLDPIDRPDYPAPTLDLDYVKSQLKEMSELRKDVDELRHLVSEHYAQEIGDNMCITQ